MGGTRGHGDREVRVRRTGCGRSVLPRRRGLSQRAERDRAGVGSGHREDTRPRARGGAGGRRGCQPRRVLLAAAVGKVARVHSSRPGACIVEFQGHSDAVSSVSFSRNDDHLLTTSFGTHHDAVDLERGDGRTREDARRARRGGAGRGFSPDGRLARHRRPEVRPSVDGGPSSTTRRQSPLYVAVASTVRAAVAFAGPKWRIYTGGVDGSLRRYDCRLCADTPVLARIAAAKLARLHRDAVR